MILSFDAKSKKVIWYNVYQTKEESESRLNETTIWIDGNMPEIEHKEGYQSVIYVNDDMESIRVEYEPIPEPEPTMDEKIYAAVNKSQDEIRQEGADMVMEELVKRGLIV